jgi:hypothetical protein
MDEFIKLVFKKFGQPEKFADVTPETLARYKGKLPDVLLGYWQEYGFCRFNGGLMFIVNPEDYEAALEEWIGDTPLAKQDDYHVVTRTAFGELELWGTKTGNMYTISPTLGSIMQHKGAEEDIRKGKQDWAFQKFICGRMPRFCDLRDHQGKPLFARAVEKLGPLGPDDVFALEPALFAGGSGALKTVAKRDIHNYLSLMAQMSDREILTQAEVYKRGFGG